MGHETLTSLTAGMPIVYGGDKVVHVTEDLAAAFVVGDRLVVVQDSGALLHIPEDEGQIAHDAVTAAVEAFAAMGSVSDEQISSFFEAFADALEDDARFAPIAQANAADVAAAKERDQSTTRLVLTSAMRAGMIDGLRGWATVDGGRGSVVRTVDHDGWKAELVRSGLGVVGFVFEGRPNVFADAAGVIRSGNTVVFRIGSAALGTARAIVAHALSPALEAAGMPAGAASLVASPGRAAGWAMFSDSRLSLAVARGSGQAVAQLGAVARQAGTPVSLHGTGGAWLMIAESADVLVLKQIVHTSLDRKVCNTLNTVCVVASRAAELIPTVLDGMTLAGHDHSNTPKLHVTASAKAFVPDHWWKETEIDRAEGLVTEPKTEMIGDDQLGEEWEWEGSPEVTLHVVETIDEAVDLFNTQSPLFGASLLSKDDDEQERFFQRIDAPFVGNGFTRWIDGQYLLNMPELGLSNWQFGRLFGRGGVLSGDSVYTVRTRAYQTDPTLRR